MPSKAVPRLPLPLIEPTLVDHPPSGARWAHEIKWDGWRVQACLTAGKATLYTRRGKDCTKRFPSIAGAMAKLKAVDVVVDGEAVAIDAEGRPDFHAVLGAGARVVYKAFDILWLDGTDLRPQLWSERKRVLRVLLGRLPKGARDTLSYVEPVHGDGAKVYASACELGLEGVVSKRVDTPYRAGRSDAWLKTRCAIVETMVVVGFSSDP
jgi:bifunctional non-homologous end joining protein LigD